MSNLEQSRFSIKRGVNISHWLSQTNRNAEERLRFFTEEDMALIASLGYDHIRLPIDEKNMWDENGQKHPLAFQSLHNAIHWAKENKLKVVVDLHIVRSHFFNNDYNALWDSVDEKEKFVGLWKQLSSELLMYPNSLVAYEILNEPVANNPESWNELLFATFMEIRIKEPFRTIVIGSNKWQSVDTFKDLEIPKDDPNIILSFHFYSPHVFTHYQAPWSKRVGFYKGSVKYPGIPVDKKDVAAYTKEQVEALLEDSANYSKKYLLERMKGPLEIAKKYNLPLYCGEFGSLPTTRKKDRLQWYRDMVSVFEDNDMAWANWDYKGNFGIVDSETNKLDKDLVNVLMRKD
ncbi:glycoside hydrolase family 5 protein [Mariniflexile ostreae]|uniref:Glycoside hydrolase family 5 protein n=1 Tax=Mariniflexile ostreae TaxID=1520892 RepID=A0ABV5FBC0_9FLAO